MAVNKDWGYGYEGDLPWNKNPNEEVARDLQNFVKCTKNQIVLMGTSTADSMKSIDYFPLPNRVNGVISRNIKLLDDYRNKYKDVETTTGHNLDLFEEKMNKIYNKDVWLIGGGLVLDAYIDSVDELHLTKFNFDDIKSDVHFTGKLISKINNDFKVTKKITTKAGTEFIVYVRKT